MFFWPKILTLFLPLFLLSTPLLAQEVTESQEVPEWVQYGTYVIDDPYASLSDYERAVALLTEQVEADNYKAMHFLGRAFFEGKGVPKDKQLGYDFIKKSADQGNFMVAQGTICKYHILGESFEKDTDKAFEYCEKSALQGWMLGQRRLAGLYQEKGYLEEALFWYEQAATQGDSYSMRVLGNAYFYGNGTEKNMDKAQLYLGGAAMSGDREAQFTLGYAYYQGDVFPKDDDMAFKLYQKAALNNHIRAQLSYGMMFWGGMGTKENLQEAYKWMLIAAQNSDCKYGQIAKGYQSKLIGELSEGEVEQASQEAAEFRSSKKPWCTS